MHIDSTRFDKNIFDILQIGHFDRAARLHWLKSYVVSNIYLDNKNESILVNIDLPEALYSDPRQNADIDWKEAIKNLENRIVSDILDDTLSVRDIFRENGICAYDMVKTNVTFIPGYPPEDLEEIKGMMGDLGIIVSPNTSKVIETAIESILSLCNKQYDDARVFNEQMEQLLEYLNKIYQGRQSHIGFKRIITLTENTLRENRPAGDMLNLQRRHIRDWQNSVKNVLNETRKQRNLNKIKLYSHCNENWLEGIENIVLFSYSEMVTKFLYEYGQKHPDWRDKVSISALECGGKRRLESDNSIEYNDGLYYTAQLSMKGFKKISLFPDTSFGSLAFNLNRNKENGKSLVIFGVNCIDKNTFDCVHTSGHLMIAVTAKYFKIPVWIIADSFKIGEIAWDPSLERHTFWLTGQKDLLKDLELKKIRLANYRHDLIPSSLITSVITEKGKDITPFNKKTGRLVSTFIGKKTRLKK